VKVVLSRYLCGPDAGSDAANDVTNIMTKRYCSLQ